MAPGSRDEGIDGAEDGRGKCIHIQLTGPECDSKSLSHRGKVLLLSSGSRLFGETELIYCGMTLVTALGGGQGAIENRDELRRCFFTLVTDKSDGSCRPSTMPPLLWLSPAGLGIVLTRALFECCFVPCCVAFSCALSGLQIACPYCCLSCPEAGGLWLPCWITSPSAMYEQTS